MKSEKILFFLLLFIICGGIVFGLTYLKKNETNFSKSDLINSKTLENENFKKNKTIFYFRMREKRWIKSESDFFPKKLEMTKKFPNNWIVLNFLNEYYPKWNKYHYITPETLTKKINKVNYIVFQPNPFAIQKKFRKTITLKDLEKLNISPKYVKTTEAEIRTFINLINDENVDWNEIKNFIEYLFPSKYIAILTRKIKENIHF